MPLPTRSETEGQTMFRYGTNIFVAVLIIFIAFSSFTIVPAGTSAVLLEWGAVNYNVHLHQGLNFIVPIQDSVVLMSTQIQIYNTASQSTSRDLQNVSMDLGVNYHINGNFANLIYNNYSEDYGNRLIVPAVQEVVKSVSANFTAEQLIDERPLAVAQMQEQLSSKLAPYHIFIDAVALKNIDFSQQFNLAIERKVVAQQNFLTNQTQLNITRVQANKSVALAIGNATSAIARAKGDAQARIISAQGNATARIINANATAQAIKTINDQLANSKDYLKYYTISQWNGQVPKVVGSGAVPLLNINTTGG